MATDKPDPPVPQQSRSAKDATNVTDVTRVLQGAEGGDPRATDELLNLVYGELRQLATARIAGEPHAGAGMTLQATSLVHEAYLRLLRPAAESPDGGPANWQGRGHFFGAAALAMRRILIERARHRKRERHGGGKRRVELDDLSVPNPDGGKEGKDATDLLALDEALKKLEQADPRKARVVTLRYFAGLSIEETAAAMDLSPATVKNEWTFARAWLRRELSDEPSGESGGRRTP